MLVVKNLNASDYRAIQEEDSSLQLCVVAMVERPQLVDGIYVLPWQDFLKRLWSKSLAGLA
jgi:hypothetical protein